MGYISKNELGADQQVVDGFQMLARERGVEVAVAAPVPPSRRGCPCAQADRRVGGIIAVISSPSSVIELSPNRHRLMTSAP
jgi:hypothetical protein